MMVVTRYGMSRIIRLICQGRMCDECPIKSDCDEVLLDSENSVVDLLETLFTKICEEK